MLEPRERAGRRPGGSVGDDLLDSWKEIAAYFRRDVSTVRRWEENEGLAVYRHRHRKRSSVYAYRGELAAWWENGHARLEASGPFPPGSSVARTWRVYIPASAALVLTALFWLGPFDRQATPPYQEWRITPLTSFPGREKYPSFSPDGSQVAFSDRKRSDFDIYVKDVYSNTYLTLTDSPDSDVSPTWSRDGRLIAFYRRFRGDGRPHSISEARRAGGAIYTILPLGGPERLLLELQGLLSHLESVPLQLSWSPDGSVLAFIDRRPPPSRLPASTCSRWRAGRNAS